jgi:hypothetical protein
MIMRAVVSLINLLTMVLFLNLIVLGESKIAHAHDQWSDGTPVPDWVNHIFSKSDPSPPRGARRKAVMNSRADEIVDLAKSNLRR